MPRSSGRRTLDVVRYAYDHLATVNFYCIRELAEMPSKAACFGYIAAKLNAAATELPTRVQGHLRINILD